MSQVENQYLGILQELVDKHTRYDPRHVNNINRTSVPATKQWVSTIRHRFEEGFPLITTKKVWFRGVVAELVGFLAGVTNHYDFQEIGGSVWGEWALPQEYVSYEMTDPQARLEQLASLLQISLHEANERIVQSIGQYGHDVGTRKIYEDNGIEFERVISAHRKGALGPIYGAVWRDFNGVDQIRETLTQLRINPQSRRHYISAWKPDVLPDENETHEHNVQDGKQVLPPCHLGFQFDVALTGDGTPYLNSMFLMRSADIFLGVPFNISSYGLLTALFAHELKYELGEMVGVLNNNHLYHDAVSVATEQLQQVAQPLPQMKFHPEVNLMKILACNGVMTPEKLAILKEQVDLIVDSLTGYNPQLSITAPVAI